MLRQFCYRICKHDYFERVILALICISSCKLILDTYWLHKDSDSIEKRISFGLDVFFTVAFTFEYLIKSIAYGFALDENSYLRESWNRLDFFIVIVSIIDVIFQDLDMAAIKVYIYIYIYNSRYYVYFGPCVP